MHIRTRLPAIGGALLLIVFVSITLTERTACAIAQTAGPDPTALSAGLAARQRHRGSVAKTHAWTLIDYSLPFTAVRLWVIDGHDEHRVLMASRVSHAWKSGLLYATRFSNR